MALNPTRLTIPRLNLSKNIPPEELAVLLNRWADSVAHAFSEVKGTALTAAHTAHKAINSSPTSGALSQDSSGTIVNAGSTTFSPTGTKLPAPPGKQVTQDNLIDGLTFARVLSTALNSGSITSAHISNQAGAVIVSTTILSFDGDLSAGTWSKVATTTIQLAPGTQTITLKVSCGSQGAGAATAGYNGIGFAIYTGGAPASPQASVLFTAGAGLTQQNLTLSSPTSGVATLALYVKDNGVVAFNPPTSSSPAALVQKLLQPFANGVLT